MLEELSKSVKAALYERVGSPFFGSLVFVFLAYHWKVPVALLATDKHAAMTMALNEALPSDPEGAIWHVVLLVLAGLVVSVAVPGGTALVALCSAPLIKFTREAHKRARDGELLTRKQGDALREEAERTLDAKHDSDEKLARTFEQLSDIRAELRDHKARVGEYDAFRRLVEKLLPEQEWKQLLSELSFAQTASNESAEQGATDGVSNAADYQRIRLREDLRRRRIDLVARQIMLRKRAGVPDAAKIPGAEELSGLDEESLFRLLRHVGRQPPKLPILSEPLPGSSSKQWEIDAWERSLAQSKRSLDKYEQQLREQEETLSNGPPVASD